MSAEAKKIMKKKKQQKWFILGSQICFVWRALETRLDYFV